MFSFNFIWSRGYMAMNVFLEYLNTGCFLHRGFYMPLSGEYAAPAVRVLVLRSGIAPLTWVKM